MKREMNQRERSLSVLSFARPSLPPSRQKNTRCSSSSSFYIKPSSLFSGNSSQSSPPPSVSFQNTRGVQISVYRQVSGFTVAHGNNQSSTINGRLDTKNASEIAKKVEVVLPVPTAGGAPPYYCTSPQSPSSLWSSHPGLRSLIKERGGSNQREGGRGGVVLCVKSEVG